MSIKNSILFFTLMVSSLGASAGQVDFKSGECMGTIAVLIKYYDNDKIGSALKSYWTKKQPYMKSVSGKVAACMGAKKDAASHEACANKLIPSEKDFYLGWNIAVNDAMRVNYSQDYLRSAGLARCGDVVN